MIGGLGELGRNAVIAGAYELGECFRLGHPEMVKDVGCSRDDRRLPRVL